jgi:hypothetical protein
LRVQLTAWADHAVLEHIELASLKLKGWGAKPVGVHLDKQKAGGAVGADPPSRRRLGKAEVIERLEKLRNWT